MRAFKIHLLIIGHIRKAMPAMFGKDKAQRKMLDRLPEVFFQVCVLAFRREACWLKCNVGTCLHCVPTSYAITTAPNELHPALH